MKDAMTPNRRGRGPKNEAMLPRPLSRSIALVLMGASGVAIATHEGLPFTESFDDAHLSSVAGTAADWGASSPGRLTLPTAGPLMGPFDPSAAGAAVGTAAQTTRDVELADMNGDGWLDLVEGSTGRNGVYLNDGAGNLLPRVDLSTDTGNSRGVAIGDIDRDGDLDVVVGNLNGFTRLYLNAGNGRDYIGYDVGTEPTRADAVALADLNGDGWLDVAVATHAFRDSLIHFHTGNPAEPFGPHGVDGQPIDTGAGLNTQTVALGDVDNDGDHDIVLINEDQPNFLFLNDGSGTLSAPIQIGAEADDSQGGALGDVNGDGWLDLVVGNYEPGQPDRVYLNSGNASAPFSNTTVPLDVSAPNELEYTHHVALADVDLDGDLDVLLSTAGLGAADPNVTRFTNRLLLNDGTGNFAVSVGIGADMDVTNAIAVGDVDGDGKPDVIAGNEDRAPNDSSGTSEALPQLNRLYRNVGVASGAGAVRQLSGYATSLRVDTETAPIAAVELEAAMTATAHDTADFWVSSNGGANWLHIEPGGGPVAFPADIRGTDLRWRVQLSSRSPSTASTFAIESVTITADAPSFTSDPIRTATSTVAYTYEVTAVDPNGDALTLSASTLPAWLTFTDNGGGSGTLTGVPAAEHVGDHDVVLDVADATGKNDQQRFTISVVGGGSPPTFTSTAPTAGTVGTEYRYDVAATDPDGDAMTFAATVLPAWLTLTDNANGTATLVGTPADADLGDNEVVLGVTDANGMTAEQAFVIAVSEAAAPPPDNNPPSFTSTPVTSATAGTAYSYTVRATDPDAGDALTISAPTLPAWLALTDNGNGTATLSGTPAAGNVGSHSVVLSVADAAGASAEQTFNVAVAAATPPPSQNNPPRSSGGGGGGTGLLELLGIAFAAIFLRRRRPLG